MIALTSLASRIGFLGAGIIGLGFLIGFHELGHFLFCKLFAIRTPSFSIGFGPRILKRKIGETEFVLSAIPLGGYVEIAGAAEVGQGEQKDAFAADEHSFARKPYYQKLLVILGGIMFNLLFAYFAFILLFATGIPQSPFTYAENATNVVKKVGTEVTAYKHKLDTPFTFKQDDVVLQANGQSISNAYKDIKSIVEKNEIGSLNLVIERDSKKIYVTIPPETLTETAPHYLGVLFESTPQPAQSFTDAIRLGIASTHYWVKETVNGFIRLFSKRNVKALAGPLAIISMTSEGAKSGFKAFLLFLAIISINLAVLNLLPLPIFDGGQLLFHTIEAIIGRQLPIRIKEYIFIISWIAILTLMLYLTFYDVKRLIMPHIQTIFSWFS